MQIYSLGTRIGPYEIASNPMIGGMGVVYFCLDHANDARPVALKTFKPEYLPDRAARDRFLREGTAWVQLGRHPHIVRCYAVEYIDPTAFLSLELIAKEQGMDDASMRSWMGAPMPVEQALLFALQIARGMKHATEKIPGFVHRDLKPENVLVGADKLPGTNINRLRVTDFGLAAILKDEVGRLKDEEPESIGRTHLTHGIVGTPLYMAPEQWKGEPVGIYTDVYALGCILYEMLTGQRAASGGTISELQAVHCAGKLRPLPADLQGELRDLLIRSLALQPAQRYQSWDDMVSVLEQAYEARGLGSVPDEGILEAESLEERRQAGRSYNAMGMAYQGMGKERVAADCYEKALVLAREIGDQQGEGATLDNLGLTFAAMGNLRRAIGVHEQALAIAHKISDRGGECAAFSNLGNVYADLGDAQRAIGYYEQALAIAREIFNRRWEGAALGNLGLAYAAKDDVRRAIGYYEQALAIAHETGNRREDGNVLGNLGGAYRRLGDARRAIGYYEQHLIIAREIGDQRGESTALGNLGSAYADLGDVRRAIGYFEQSLTIKREIGDINGVASISFNMALLYQQQGDPARALPLAQEAAQAFVKIGHPGYTQRAQALVAQLRQLTGK